MEKKQMKRKTGASAKKTGAAFINGKIFTADDTTSYADAMLLENGLIQWIGKGHDMPAHRYPIYDLKGRRVVPGFVDAHIHAAMLAETAKQISCLPPNVTSLEDLKKEIGRRREQQEAEEWIEGWGLDEGKLKDKRLPNRYDLDDACADAPVIITRTCLHVNCVNSKALELAGINRDTPDLHDGQIDRDENGEPTGVLRESARDLITRIKKMQKERTNRQDMEEGLAADLIQLGERLAAQGITTVADMGDLNGADHYEEWIKATEQGFRQQVAMYYMWEFFAMDGSFQLPAERFSKDTQIRFAGLKLIGDGSVSGRTAWREEPYLGDGKEYGMSVCSEALMESAIDFCKTHKCQLSMHAMGKKAIDRIVDRVYEEEPWTEDHVPFVRLEHVTEPSEAALKKCAEKRIAYMMQPVFLYAEIEKYLENIGLQQTCETYPVRSALEKGIQVGFSTDAPATAWADPSDPMVSIQSAVTRMAYDGTDCGQNEKVDVAEAIKCYTVRSAYISGFADTGMLRKGYRGDFVVLDKDILEVPAEEIHKVKPVKTYIAGQLVWDIDKYQGKTVY